MPDERSFAALYAPHGRLRVALNFGNRVLIGRDASGRPVGITADIAHRLASELGLPLELIAFDRAVDVSSRATADAWDICFLAVDPERAKTIAFTAPYVRISGCYLLAGGRSETTPDQVVADGLRVGVVDGSAYTLHLARQRGAEHLVTFSDIHAALAAFDSGAIDALAGVAEALLEESAKRPGSRVLQPPFMEINQAMGVPIARAAAAADLRDRLAGWIEHGVMAGILGHHGLV